MTRFFYLFLFCSILTVTGCNKKDIKAGGETGMLKWTLSKDGIFTVDGIGEMPDYWVTPTENLPVWNILRNDIVKVIIGNDVSKIGDYAFFRCSKMTSVTIGQSVISIGHDAFAGCSRLTSVIIPNSVTDIGYGAFYGCSDMKSVTIGKSVINIGDYTFSSCSNLAEIINQQEIPCMLPISAIEEVNTKTCILYVPAGSIENYRASRQWRVFENIKAISIN